MVTSSRTAYLREQGHFSVPDSAILRRLDSINIFQKDGNGNEANITSTYERKQTSFIYGGYYNHSQFVNACDQPSNSFTRRNLYQWRLFGERTLRPTRLDSHLVNSKLEEEDGHYFKWLDEEDILLTWLLDFMKPEVGDQIIDYDSVKDMWDAVIELYSKLDESRIADFNKRAMELL